MRIFYFTSGKLPHTSLFEIMILMNNLNLESKIILKKFDLMEGFRNVERIKIMFVREKIYLTKWNFIASKKVIFKSVPSVIVIKRRKISMNFQSILL